MSSGRLIGIAVVLLAVLVAAGLILFSADESEPPAEGFVPYDAPAKQAKSNDGPAEKTAPTPVPAPHAKPTIDEPKTALAKPATLPGANREGEVLNISGPLDSQPSAKTPEDDTPKGTLSRESVKAGIKSVTPVFRACYESALEDFPEAEGKVILDFDITAEAGRGRISMSEVDGKKTTLFDNKLHDCMQETLVEVTFEAPKDGAVHVKYPFVFKTGEDD